MIMQNEARISPTCYTVTLFGNHLHYDSFGFISNSSFLSFSIEGEKVIALQVEFEQSAFDDELFVRYEIPCPLEISQSVVERRAEFFAGRLAAKLLLLAHGASKKTVDINPDRSPHFPDPFTGSISHSHSQAIVALHPKSNNPTLHVGIDIQCTLSEQEAQDVSYLIAKQTEINVLACLGYDFRLTITLLFSSKEALFKSIFPNIHEVLEFSCVTLKAVEADTLIYTAGEYLQGLGIQRELRCTYRWQHKERLISIAMISNRE
ncbi:4'-phosphopantetheinyl transferase [Enterovibrio calviensis]|uniref:4'-phosphopantetheinyl transferase family protein n=1 Tax=Enterovibrio calviensis TaxID=91359 RepID=UPI0037352101